MTITPTGFLQYEVVGQEGTYFVDLEVDQCSCPHYRCVVAVERRKGKKMDCKHIRNAKIYGFDEIKPLLIKHWNKKL